jgi:hypothetical protein
MRLAEQRIGRPVRGAQRHQAIQQLLDRRFTKLGISGVRGLAGRGQSNAEGSARRRTETKVGGLAVDQEARLRGDAIGGLRAIAAALFAADEDQSDARLAFGSQTLSGRDLRGEDAFRIAGAAAIQRAVLDTAGEKRRHTIKMGGKNQFRLAGRGDDIDPGDQGSGIRDQGIEWLFED